MKEQPYATRQTGKQTNRHNIHTKQTEYTHTDKQNQMDRQTERQINRKIPQINTKTYANNRTDRQADQKHLQNIQRKQAGKQPSR